MFLQLIDVTFEGNDAFADLGLWNEGGSAAAIYTSTPMQMWVNNDTYTGGYDTTLPIEQAPADRGIDLTTPWVAEQMAMVRAP